MRLLSQLSVLPGVGPGTGIDDHGIDFLLICPVNLIVDLSLMVALEDL